MSMFSRAIGLDKKKNQARDAAAAVLKQQQAPGGVIANQTTLDQQAAGSLATGAATTNTAIERTKGFDPSAAVSKYASGMWDEAINNPNGGLKRQLTDLGGRSVGAGRLNTGFFDADQGDVITNVMHGYGNSVASTALAAAGMEQGNNNTLFDMGQAEKNTGLDLTAGRYNEQQTTAEQKAAKERAKKRGIGSAIGGVLGGVGGFFAGGPAGASAGYKIGSGIGGGF